MNVKRKNLSSADKPMLDYGLSVLIAMHIRAIWGHCYENAYSTFFAFPELFEPDGLFVEGWIVFEEANDVVLMEHSWLVCGNRIIDPTIVLAVDPHQPVSYFPGVCRAQAELEALDGEFFPHVRFEEYGKDGMGHPDYRAAYEAAQEATKKLVSGEKTLVEVRAAEPIEESQEETPNALQMFILHS